MKKGLNPTTIHGITTRPAAAVTDPYAFVKTDNFRISHSISAVTETTSFRHMHDAFELILYVKADLSIFIRDTPYEVRSGDLVLINEYDIHSITYREISEYERYVLYFKRDFLMPLLKALQIPDLLDRLKSLPVRKIHLTLHDFSAIRVLMEAITLNRKTQSGENNTRAHAKAMSSLVLLLLRLESLLETARPKEPGNKTSQLVQQIVGYIDTHFSNPIRLDDLQQLFFADRFRISHVFKEQTGFSVMEYVQYRRIAEAQKMLQNTSIDILNLYLDCGFNNAQHFYRVFKKICGTTPEKYRSAFQKKKPAPRTGPTTHRT